MYLDINRNSTIPIKKQLYDALTVKILQGELEEGDKLPSSRQLAEELDIARNTVVEIYEQLIAEAYLITRKGSGTFVSDTGKCDLCGKKKTKPEEGSRKVAEDTYAEREPDLISLIPGIPDLTHYPHKAWQNAYRDVAYKDQNVLFEYGGYFGYRPLREALVKYLLTHKGIYCRHQQILITSGAKDAFRMLGLALNQQYSHMAAAAPTTRFPAQIFERMGYGILPITVDQEGLVIEDLQSHLSSVLIYISSSRQAPVGGTLSIARRMAFVEFARTHGHLIIEDDYEREFRYRGAPGNSLFQLSDEDVVHVGSFSRTLAPALRLGYMVVPEKILEVVRESHALLGTPPPTMNQAVVGEMIANGSYEKHIYKMTRIYKAKMAEMVNALETAFGEEVVLSGITGGLHLFVRFPDITFTSEHQRVFNAHGVAVSLSNHYLVGDEEELRGVLALGFGHLQEEDFPQAAVRLKQAIEAIRSEQGE